MVKHADYDDITFHFTDSGSSPTIDCIFLSLFLMYPIDSLLYLIISFFDHFSIFIHIYLYSN